MNGSTQDANQPLELVDIVDFKWLMASDGLRVNVERLQTDRDYAAECFARASLSRCEPLRHAALRLRTRLGL